MQRILFDTNIILDWLLERKGFYHSSSRCIELFKDSKVEGCLTPHSVSDIFYIIRKEKGLKAAKELIRLLVSIFSVLTEDENTVSSIMESELWNSGTWNDIEDGLQMVSAQLCSMDLILTRNLKDFKYSSVKCLSPEEYLKSETEK